jgi:hypothetical protein
MYKTGKIYQSGYFNWLNTKCLCVQLHHYKFLSKYNTTECQKVFLFHIPLQLSFDDLVSFLYSYIIL